MPATKKTPGCRVCAGVEPGTVDKLLLLGHCPRWIAPKFGHTRRTVAKHRDLCLTGARGEKVAGDLRRMADEAEGGVRRG